jgi:hypothetical protein
VRNVLGNPCRGYKKSQLCSIAFIVEQRALFVITWKNVVNPGTQQMMLFTLVPKATNTLSEYVVITVFTLQKWLYERTLMLRFTYISGPVWF